MDFLRLLYALYCDYVLKAGVSRTLLTYMEFQERLSQLLKQEGESSHD